LTLVGKSQEANDDSESFWEPLYGTLEAFVAFLKNPFILA